MTNPSTALQSTPLTTPIKESAEPPQKPNPVAQKTQSLATPVLQKEEVKISTCKRIWIVIRDKLIAFFKKIAECFRNVFGCDDDVDEVDDEESSDEKPSLTKPQVAPAKDSFKILDKLLDDINISHLKQFNPSQPATFIGFRRLSFEKGCQELANALSLLREAPEQPTPAKLVNIGNSCYMNTAIQNLTKLFFGNVDVKKWDLILQPEETLADFEVRSLRTWAPIAPLKPNSTRADFKDRYKQILFKWSFLLLVQAQKLGSVKAVEEALRLHRKICFSMCRGDFYPEAIAQQLDITAYLNMWHELLEIHFDWQITRNAFHKGELLSQQKTDPRALFEIPIPEKISKKEMQPNFLKLVYKEWHHEEENDGYRFTTADKQEVVPAKFNSSERFDGRPPEQLIFSYKRFKKGDIKIDTPIPLGFDPTQKVLDLRKVFANREALGPQDALYQLSGIAVHLGGTGGGHYVSYIRNTASSWNFCDDSSITPIELSQVPFDKAYVLTFKRVQ